MKRWYLILLFVLTVQTVSVFAVEYPELAVSDNKFFPIALWQSVDHVLGRHSATAYVFYDENSLHINISGETDGIRYAKGEGTYAIFGGHTAEIFLVPDPASDVYYQLAVSPDNRTYIAKGGDAQWKSGAPIKMKGIVDGNKWTAVLEIPFAAFGRKTPAKGEVWKANFVFGKSWSHTTDYHDPSQYGTLVFGKKAETPLALEEFVFRDDTFRVRVTNYSREPQTFSMMTDQYTIQPGTTVTKTWTPTGRNHKNIRRCSLVLNGQTVSGLAPVETDKSNWNEPFYAQKPEKIAPPQGDLTIKGKVFYAAGKPFYPVVANKNKFLHIAGAFSCSFAREPLTGYLVESDVAKQLPVLEKSVQRAQKERVPVLFRILYESQMPLIFKEKDGSQRVAPDAIAYFETLYKAYKKAYPGKIFSMHADGALQLKERAQRCCDVIEYASWGSSYAPAMVPYLADDLAQIRDAAGEKPVLFWLGTFKARGVDRSAEELRCGIFLTLLNGCAGNVIHLGHGGIPKENKRAWDMLDHIQDEINAFYPVYAQGVVEKCTEKHAPHIVCAKRRAADGTQVHITVNTSPVAADGLSPYGVKVDVTKN